MLITEAFSPRVRTSDTLHPVTSKGLPAFPNGWYGIGFSDELPRGGVLRRHFMGQEVVAFRAQSGVVSVIDAYCPHLGAHLGYRSDVIGEAIRCPFHYFTFDTQGHCISTGYGTKPPPKAAIRTWPVREQHGILLVWYHAEGKPPEWEVPVLPTEGYLPLRHTEWNLRSHPQETTENSVDIGHLGVVHGYHDVEILSDLVTDGPYLNVRYAMRRPVTVFGRTLLTTSTEFEVHVYGLGYSHVDVNVESYGVQTRMFVLACPTDAESITLRVAASTRRIDSPRKVHPLLGIIPKPLIVPLLNRLFSRVTLAGLAHDVAQDFEIWQHKVYFSPPILAEGDGPVGRYRYWARQFYAGDIDVPALSVDPAS